MTETQYIGKRIRSKEAPRHVSGGGQFVDDLSLPGMLHAVVLRSSYAHARMGHIDTREALEVPGVVAVLTSEEVKRTSRPFKPGRYSAGLQ